MAITVYWQFVKADVWVSISLLFSAIDTPISIKVCKPDLGENNPERGVGRVRSPTRGRDFRYTKIDREHYYT
jgi:hypothetical protein